MSSTTSQGRVYGAAPPGPLPAATFILVSDGTVEPIGCLNRATAAQVAELLAPLVGAILAGTSTPTPTPSQTPAPTPTPAPAPAADGTLSGLPATIVAGQQLSAVTYSQPQTVVMFALHRVSTNADEGSYWPSSVMLSGLNLLIPQNAGAYTVRSYAYPGPVQNPSAALLYESPQFTATAPPGALPATPMPTADTGATATGVTMNWTSTAPSYLVLAAPGTGTAYGTLANTTVSTNSYTFAHLSANSGPRAVIIPQNANGYGAAALCLSSVTATAVANETLTLDNPGPQTSGSTFSLSGTYSGITPTVLDYQYAGQPAWNTAASQNVTITNGTFTIAGVLLRFTTPNMVYAVRDHNNPANTATTPAFAVS